jgi:hypothetical protein
VAHADIQINAARNFMKQYKSKPQKVEKCLSLLSAPYSRDSVDLSLIQWMLSFTPTQRLQILQHNIRSIMRLRGGKADT